MSGRADFDVAIHEPAAGEMKLHQIDGSPNRLLLNIHPDAWLTLHLDASAEGCAAQAAAMRKLAGLATEAAAELDRRAAQAATSREP